ncbi:MAG: hypothetical protein JNM70_18705 [Anaerolineae bacterium]|nr:hypothetical protein [Anaerolineae bacterium]
MAIEIRPFSQESGDLPADDDSRAATFMERLRARVAVADEKQRQKWAKSTKPSKARKPFVPNHPSWLVEAAPKKAAPVPLKDSQSRPNRVPKKKRAV